MADRTHPQGPVDPAPTPFPDLNALLLEVVERARDILGDLFVGAYLQGSFAVGGADLYSDCDFLIPVAGPITWRQEERLRAVHRQVPARPGHWCTELEGSYPDRSQLRSLDGLGEPWLYVDRGHTEMQWSTHCNTEVVRWSLRERGVPLVGPAPTALVDPVPAEVLRRTMRRLLPRFHQDLMGWATWEVAWTQRYAVATYCRMLHTLSTGEVTSKPEALRWATEVLDARWEPLVAQALADRSLPWDDPPRPGSVEETLQLGRYAEALVRYGWAADDLTG